MSAPATATATGTSSVGPVLRVRHADSSIAPLAFGPGVAPVAVPWGTYVRLVPTAADIVALQSGTQKTVYAFWDDSVDAAASGWYLATVVKSYDAGLALVAPEFDFKIKYLRDNWIQKVRLQSVGMVPATRAVPVPAPASASASAKSTIRALAARIAALSSKSSPCHDILDYNAGQRAGWLQQRCMADVLHQHYDAVQVAGGNSLKDQMIALLVSFDTSSGRVQGPLMHGAPGTNLVLPSDTFRRMLLRVDWYNMTELLRPADFMKHRENVFNRALLVWSTSPILRDLWHVLVLNANALLDGEHQIGPEASVRVLQTVMQYNFLSIQKTYRIGGLNAIPDHFNKDSLRSQLRHTPLKLGSELNLIAKTVGVPAAELQHYLLAVNLGGGGGSGRGQDSSDAAAAARQRTALSAATGAVNAQDCACDYTVTLESSDHGIIFGRSDREERRRQRSSERDCGAGSASASVSADPGPGPAVMCQCVVASLPSPSASAGSAQSAKRVKLYDTLGIAVGDVVRSVSSFPTASDSRAATRRVDLDPIAFLVDGVVPYVLAYC